MSQTNRIYRECGLNSRATKISKSHQLLLISMRTLHAIMQQFAPLLHKDNELSPGCDPIKLWFPMNHYHNTALSCFILSDDYTNLGSVLSHTHSLLLFVVCVYCPLPSV